MRATARVDRTLCRGTGLCEVMDSRLFSLSDDGTALARPLGPGHDPEALLEQLQDIADCCPTGAITITTTDEE
ncbi:ferredoxin [Streptomyces sp. NBC_01525]|uniref:Ferredoxin n=1 Tax=Streptomyces benahoarensis TaxID=2595054 RepID=A0A553ZNQ6_9ACTN|nr:ferredoxin [Streptomyces benahoarensis]TSB26775.1 ferredoxin [Streptomyces benahoarensis]TSB43104.1 ferredoxin [Streptomyces benahoarensis]